MENLYTFILTLLWLKLAVNSTTTVDPRRPIFTSTPSRSNSVLVGRNIKLEWSFKIQSVNDLSEISLYSYELRSKAKKKIALKNVKSGEFLYRTGFKGRYVCEISFTENGIGRASISISNVQFNQTYDYGIILKLKGKGHLPTVVENSVSVRVVDMVRRDTRKDSKIIRSWFGQKLVLECDVVYVSVKPVFEWSRKSLTGNTVQKLDVPNDMKTLIIENVNTTDFGEYFCLATSPMMRIKQKFRVHKLGYAGSPKNVKYRYYPYSRSYALYWEQPSTHNGHWVRKYVLEEWKENKAMWVQRHNITTLTVTVKNIESTKRYRICSANEIGYKNTSCSKSVVLLKTREPTSDERGTSSQFWPSLGLVLLMTLLTVVFSEHH